MSGQQYQLFAPLRAEEYDALKADIAKRGVLVPVEVDEDGRILDGHHRARIAAELGVTYDTITRSFDTEGEKVEHVLKINLLRRHLGPIAWADGFKKLAEQRGIRLGTQGKQKAKTPTIGDLADEVGVKPNTARHRLAVAEEFAAVPDIAEKLDRGEMDVKRARRVMRERAAEQRRAAPIVSVTVVDDIDIRLGDFREVLDLEPGSVDAIITDPPYPAEFIPLLGDVARIAAKALKPSGVVVALLGQYHLRAYMEQLEVTLDYRWVGAFVAQGPRTRVHAAKVGTGWKPVLVYQRPDAVEVPWLLDDVVTSDGDDKQHHHWGQNVAAFRQLVERFTEPDALVVDPFLGGGTTAVVCRELGRRFIGCDIDAAAVATARERVA